MRDRACDHCKERGLLGMDIRAYSFATPKGNNVVRFLHASDGGRACYQEFDAKYKAWMTEQREKVASSE